MNLENLTKGNNLMAISSYMNSNLRRLQRELDMAESTMKQAIYISDIHQGVNYQGVYISDEEKSLAIMGYQMNIPLTEEVLNFLKTQVTVYEDKIKQIEEKFNQL